MSESKVQWGGTTEDGRNVSTIWGNNPFTWGDVSLAEEIAEVIDGGNMSCCWSTTGEDGEKVEPHVEYYGGEDEAPELSKTLGELAEIDMGEEYVYLWFMGEWNCYSISRTHDEHWNVTKTNISPVTIPQEEIAS